MSFNAAPRVSAHCLEEATCKEDKRKQRWGVVGSRRFCETKQMLESGLRGRVESISEGSNHWRGAGGICFARLRLIVLMLKGVRGRRWTQSKQFISPQLL